MIFCGDFYQLPPINNDYCFKSKIWDMLKIQIIELKHPKRKWSYSFDNSISFNKINHFNSDDGKITYSNSNFLYPVDDTGE